MKRTKLAASLLAVSLAATTLLAGCKDDGNSSDNSGSNSGNSNNSENSGTGNSGDGSSVELPGDGNELGDEWVPTLEIKSGTTIRTAVGYNSKTTGISFVNDDSIMPQGGLTLADGKTYQVGDLKPTWAKVEEILGVKLEDHYQGNSGSNEYSYWDAQLDQIDFLSCTAAKANENGAAGKLVNLADYLDDMPYFKAYLEANPIVRLSITGIDENGDLGAIYFSPYFDGVNDIERMPLMRTDWVEKLLNGSEPFTAESSDKTATPVYTPYMPTSSTVSVDVVKKDGSGTQTITKDYSKYGNIIEKMNEAGSMDGDAAVNMLREYIDKTYDGYYGNNRADLFIGQNAAWDVDELVALLRCVTANSATLNANGTKVQGIFSREDDNNQRRVDMFRFAAHLFGVRGLESRNDYLYVGTDGKLHDARMEQDAYDAMAKMRDMATEGLIATSFIDGSKESTKTMLQNDLGFMHYDYNQTQTLYNDESQKVLNTDGQTGEKYMAVMPPVAKWQDGTSGGKWMRFTESWRSVKTDGWVISKAGIEKNPDALNALLSLIDFAYSKQGQVLMSYGPDAFIKTNSDGSYVTFDFNGEKWPIIADATYEELWDKAKGNYTNYARQFLGSTLSFAKSQAFEYQCTQTVGKEGAGYISTAIALGTIKHPLLEVADNPWYTSVPTVLPTTKAENDTINSYTELGSAGQFSTSKASDSNSGINLFCEIIRGKNDVTVAEAAAKVTNEWGGKQILEIREMAWEDLVDYYNDL